MDYFHSNLWSTQSCGLTDATNINIFSSGHNFVTPWRVCNSHVFCWCWFRKLDNFFTIIFSFPTKTERMRRSVRVFHNIILSCWVMTPLWHNGYLYIKTPSQLGTLTSHLYHKDPLFINQSEESIWRDEDQWERLLSDQGSGPQRSGQLGPGQRGSLQGSQTSRTGPGPAGLLPGEFISSGHLRPAHWCIIIILYSYFV